MVHKPKHKVHSFRGLIGDGGQDEINLERSNVNLAYRVIKFKLMAENPGTTAYEHVVKIYRESQSTAGIDGTIDFTNTDLLVSAYLEGQAETPYPDQQSVLFDNVLFSRNIFVTHDDVNSVGSGLNCNYYIELEEVPVGSATLMQLKLGVARKLNLSQDPVVT